VLNKLCCSKTLGGCLRNHPTQTGPDAAAIIFGEAEGLHISWTPSERLLPAPRLPPPPSPPYQTLTHNSNQGGKKDSWDIDYQATKNVLDAARKAGAKHFVLLSAICVQRPLLEFQKAKLKLEAELAAAGDITYSIVRPTAFFKSLAGQVGPLRGCQG
jgi:hypothetical protein